MDAFLAGLGAAFTLQIMLLVVAGTLLGIVVGALPGISGSTTTALLLPLTITMSPNAAVAFLGAIYCAANYGGSITAILINSPGDPSASATAFDGYALARRGEAGRALGMSAVASAIGGIFSVIVLIVAAPLLARLAYQFGPPEYFALALFGLTGFLTLAGLLLVARALAPLLRGALARRNLVRLRPIERELALLRAGVAREQPELQRKALDSLALALGGNGTDDLAGSARRLAWSGRALDSSAALELASEVERRLRQGAR